MTSRYPDVDGNWQWPEKTWFRQRLSALKAQENENRRKPLGQARQSEAVSGVRAGENKQPDSE